MKTKELMVKLSILNPERDIEFRAYIAHKDKPIDMTISDVRITKEGKIVISNQCGVD